MVEKAMSKPATVWLLETLKTNGKPYVKRRFSNRTFFTRAEAETWANVGGWVPLGERPVKFVEVVKD